MTSRKQRTSWVQTHSKINDHQSVHRSERKDNNSCDSDIQKSNPWTILWDDGTGTGTNT